MADEANQLQPKPPWSIRKWNDNKLIEEFGTLREGIPDALRDSLLTFAERHFTELMGNRATRVDHLARLLDRPLPRASDLLLAAFGRDEDLLLDAIDHALAYPNRRIQDPLEAAHTIRSYFYDARTNYDVIKIDDNEYRIAFRQPPELAEIVEVVISDTGRASEHLRRAWSLGFARHPDPTNACIEATKAVEAAARGTIIPNDPIATLGKMIRAMEAKPSKWQTDFGSPHSDDLKTIIRMMKMIWENHLRHGNPDEPLDVPVEQCEMIVHTAAILVHWFQSGRIRRA